MSKSLGLLWIKVEKADIIASNWSKLHVSEVKNSVEVLEFTWICIQLTEISELLISTVIKLNKFPKNDEELHSPEFVSK